MTSPNQPYIQVYPAGSTIPIYDMARDIGKTAHLKYSTGYPEGLFLNCSFYIPRDILMDWELDGGQRLVVRNGIDIVWEGKLDTIEAALDASSQGITLTATGYYGALLGRIGLRKPWADTRMTGEIWVYDTTASGAEKCTVDYQERIRFTPKAEAWLTNEFAQVKCSPPTGQTFKRITFDYAMAEGAQAWKLALYNQTTPTTEWSITASGTGSQDITFGTPSTDLHFYFQAAANQTAKADGTYYGEITNLVVYTETGAIQMDTIANYIAANTSGLNTDLDYIIAAASPLSLVPFVVDDWSTMRSAILEEATSYGDALYNRWAAYILESDKAETIDGYPVLAVQQFPALIDWEYVLPLEDPESYNIKQDFSQVYNWIVCQYRDAAGKTVVVTPDDDATLKDTVSIAAYGYHSTTVDPATSSAAVALNFARTFLAANKDPKWVVGSSIPVKGWIKDKYNNLMPVCQIRAGERVHIPNYLTDLSGSGLTLLIARAEYDDDGQTTNLTFTVDDSLAVILAQLSRTGQAGGGGGGAAPVPNSGIVTVVVSTVLNMTHSTVLVDTTGGNIIITLPSAVGISSKIYTVKRITAGANTLTIDGAGAETIDGAANQAIAAQWASLTVQSDGTAWFIL
jgi:hypothetical protein